MLRVDAIVLGNGKVYFFEGSQYVRYDQEIFQQDPGYPQPIAGNWPGLWESDIDAATNWGSSGEAFFFKGSEYTGYYLQADRADDPKPIEGNWSGVWDSDIDAALDWGNGKVYFFKGSEYVRYDIAADKADDGYPQRIEGSWAGLWSEGIDAAVNWGNGKAYFFRGDEYVSYDIAADSVDSGYPRKIAGGWPPSTSMATATPGQLSAGRQNMLDLINKWMPTSLLNPRADGKSVEPPGQDLLAKAGWAKVTGQDNKKKKDAGEGFATSCGDVLKALLTLWKSNFVGAFNIRDSDATGRGPGAKELGYYVERDQLVIEGDVVKSPKPGDIIVLRNGVGKSAIGVGHVGILVEARKDKWKTADGGGGLLPDQIAAVTERDVRWVDGVPIMKSVTDIKEKELDGWIDLDKLEQTAG